MTGRGSSMALLIREGSDGPAITRVSLLNVGADAYQRDKYGKTITIERRIFKRGNSDYRIMSESGKVHNGGLNLHYILSICFIWD